MRKSKKTTSTYEKRIDFEEMRELFFEGAAKAVNNKCWDSLVTIANAVVAFRQFESARKHLVWNANIVEDNILGLPDRSAVAPPSSRVRSRTRRGVRRSS